LASPGIFDYLRAVTVRPAHTLSVAPMMDWTDRFLFSMT
jgi:hypothetical protein